MTEHQKPDEDDSTKLELAEYKLSDRVEERVWKNLRTKGLAAIAVFTVIGVPTFCKLHQSSGDKKSG